MLAVDLGKASAVESLGGGRYGATLDPGWVIDGARVAAALVAAVRDPAVRRLTHRRLIGSVDQWSDSTDLKDGEFRADVRRFYS